MPFGRFGIREKRSSRPVARLPPLSPLSSASDVSSPPLTQRAKDAAKALYHTTVVELKLASSPPAPSKDGRHIPLALKHQTPLVDSRRGDAYVSNHVHTSRYTLWDFIPKQLLFQFSRIGNFYFLCVGIPQTVPGLSTTGSFTTILPLFFFVLLSMAKEGFDDYRRHRLDQVENAAIATVLGRRDELEDASASARWLHRLNPLRTRRPNPPALASSSDEHQGFHWAFTRWSNVKVGDVVRLSRDEAVPADIVLLHSDSDSGVAYVDTMALDGETNLKTKHVCHALSGCHSIEGMANAKAEFVVEDPNPDLFNFRGRVNAGSTMAPLTLDHVVYRGSVLRNTKCAAGLVINTGEECKLRMNSNQHPRAKRPALEKVVNNIVITLAIYVFLLSLGLSLGYVGWQRNFESQAWYLDRANVPFHQIIIAFIIMFNNMVPLSLYISLEVVKLGQFVLLNSDLNMYHKETDTPARCNTNTILENLGQVGYIFSDKTGTLTENVMKFRKLSVAGTVWLHEMDMQPQAVRQNASATNTPLVHSAAWTQLPKRPDTAATAIPEDGDETDMAPESPSPSSSGPTLSSHWRSTGRPDHVQPEVNTSDLLEYVRLRPYSAFSRKAREYMMAVAICHTCLPEIKDGKLEYQASSPDELALVRAAQELGFQVIQRTPKNLTLRVRRPDEQFEEMVIEILDVIEFSSARKRMSLVVRYPDGRISIICKGADSAILPRLRLSSLAMQKAAEVRESAEIQREQLRRSEQQEPRNSLGGRPSLTLRHNTTVTWDLGPPGRNKPTPVRSKSFDMNKLKRSSLERARGIAPSPRGFSLDVSRSLHSSPLATQTRPTSHRLDFLDNSSTFDESEVFARCFQHLDAFATEGLRTLLYAQKFLSEQDYKTWKTFYDEASTSLTNRQDRIEAAADMMEQSLDLVGATAIEDKLQKGVPQTIDRLRRANIKIWMLTGDKRETAINIAHSARICRPGSDLYVLDVAKGALEPQLAALAEDVQAGPSHSVVVIDGQTLAVVERSPDLTSKFFAIAVLADSVVCCRASPAQKALLVRAVRSRLRSSKAKTKADAGRGLTLAIGDGANDLAMIQASHVGVGISGNEGLQAARVADYAIVQFRFLQRLLLVHGRWNYVRTAKFILCTFWKEMFFYLPTAQYQRYNGYGGTSLYHQASLTVFNTLFTSLCTICMGILEQDLSADTLLAVPELYVFGQCNLGLNMGKYLRWMLLAAIEGVIVWHGVVAGYDWFAPGARDNGLYALGTLAFTVGVLWINWKLFILETHYKTALVLGSFLVTTGGWFGWIAFLDAIYPRSASSGAYFIRNTFRGVWGKDAAWWATVFVVLALLGLLEVAGKAMRRRLLIQGLWHWPPWRRQSLDDKKIEEWDVELWQELELDPAVREQLRVMAQDEEDVVGDVRPILHGVVDDDEEEEEEENDDDDGVDVRAAMV